MFSVQQLLSCSAANHFLLSLLLFFLLIVSISDLITLHISLHRHLFFLLIVSISDLITLHISLHRHLLSLNFANICHETFTILLIPHALEKVSRAARTYEATKKKSNSLLRG